MSDIKQHNEIHPKLESILKEELCNRAEKLQKIEVWKEHKVAATPSHAAEMANNPVKPAEKSRHSKWPYALGGIAAAIIIGVFIINPVMINEDSECPSLQSSPVGPIYRGSLVDPTIIEAMESGNKEAAIRMIDSCLQVCKHKLTALDTLTITQEIQQEVEDQRLMLKQEIQELDSLRLGL